MLGAGSSLVYTPSVAILGHYFSKRIGIVNGFVTTGSSIFAVGLPHLLKVLFTEIGVRVKTYDFHNFIRYKINFINLYYHT